MRPIHVTFFLSGILIFLGVAVLIGWHLHAPSLIRIFIGLEAMPPATGLGFVLSGIAMMTAGLWFYLRLNNVKRRDSSIPDFLTLLITGCSIALILLSTWALVEWMSDIPLGISPDPTAIRTWFTDTIIPYPGRMRPLAALGFIALGLGFYLLPRPTSTWALLLPPILTISVFFIGLLGIIGPLTEIGVHIFTFVGPAFTAGVGFVMSSIGLLLLQSTIVPYQYTWHRDEGRKITLIAVVIVVATGLVGIIGGFGVMYHQAVKEMEENLEGSLKYRRDALETAIREALRDSYYFTNQRLLNMGTTWRLTYEQDKMTPFRDRIIKAVARYREFAFSGALFRDADGRILVRDGKLITNPDFNVALKTPVPSELIWSNGFTLRLHIPMMKNGKLVGTFEVERPLSMSNDLPDNSIYGNTLDFPVCAQHGTTLQCFPFRSAGWKVISDLSWTLHGEPISLAYGREGRSGIVRTIDYRGVPVIAAYGPVGDLGLVANLEVDAAEFYKPIVQRLWALFLVLLVISTVAIFLLCLQVLPLVRRMTSEIDERMIAEANLQESEARLAEITSTLCEGICVFDEHGIVTFVNPETERILGWSPAELLGKSVHDVFCSPNADGSHSPLTRTPMYEVLLTGRTIRSTDILFVHKNSNPIPVSLALSPIIRNGVIKGCVASFEDITQIKHTEAELRKYKEHLELIVEKRTSELQKLNHELEAFSYSVSHDLRAPLRAINGFNTVLREDFGSFLPPDAHQYLDRVDQATIRMGKLVDGLLSLSQVSRREVNFNKVNLSHIAHNIKSSLSDSDPVRNVVFLIEDDLVAIGDSRLLHALLENLFGNAWKFTSRKPYGHIEFGSKTADQVTVFYIRDNGSGFDKQFSDKLFQPFQRFHGRDEFPGDGIGLATVHRIIERHGGSVWAESKIGIGTTIYFTLMTAMN